MPLTVVRDVETLSTFADEIRKLFRECQDQYFDELYKTGTVTKFQDELHSMYLKLIVEIVRELRNI